MTTGTPIYVQAVRRGEYMRVGDRGSVVAGAVWMLMISLLLFWLPLIGPLLAGIVGGKRAGGVGEAIAAAFLPALGMAVFVAVIGAGFGLPLIGLVTGAATFIAVAGAVIGPLLVGAVIGGLLA
ncbi:MAG TPA: hypothetical protein VLI39_10785 [Sedimentisphaerales bacterium]|nr:hypothetical protein [Sedimentisphaerales bacterium]